MKLVLILLKDVYAIIRLEPETSIPKWINNSDFYSVTRTQDELSIVCKQTDVPCKFRKISKDWRILKIEGPLDFSLTGIIARISGILSQNQIPIFTISTFDTDYVLAKNKNLDEVLRILKSNNYKIISEE